MTQAGRPNFPMNLDKRTRGHSKKLMKIRSRLLVRGNFFSERFISVLNSLPESVVAASSVNAFKNRFDDKNGKTIKQDASTSLELAEARSND